LVKSQAFSARVSSPELVPSFRTNCPAEIVADPKVDAADSPEAAGPFLEASYDGLSGGETPGPSARELFGVKTKSVAVRMSEGNIARRITRSDDIIAS